MTPVEEELEKDIKFVLDNTILNPESLRIIATTVNPPLTSQEVNTIKIYIYRSVSDRLIQYPSNYKYVRSYASFLRKEVSKSDKTDKGETLFRVALEYEVNRIFVPLYVSS